MRKVIPLITAFFCTVIEYYDYALYGFLANHIRNNFLPEGINTPLFILLVFSIAPIFKIIGALIFGHISDKYGRTVSLRISIVGIVIATFIIGITPSVEHIGYLATSILIVCRAFQGIFLAGEADSISTYIVEKYNHRPFFHHSIIGFCSGLGILLASTISSLIIKYNYSWRLAFIASSIFGLYIMFSRRSLPETNLDKKNIWKDFPTLISNNKVSIIISMLLCGAISGIYKFYFIFMSQFIPNILHILDYQIFQQYITYAVFAYMLGILFSGYIADYVTPKIIITPATCLLFINMIKQAEILASGQVNFNLICITAFFIGALQSIGIPIILSIIEQRERTRTLGISHSLGSSIIGGTTPILCTLIWQYSNSITYVISYFLVLTFIAGLSSISILEYHQIKTIDKKV